MLYRILLYLSLDLPIHYGMHGQHVYNNIYTMTREEERGREGGREGGMLHRQAVGVDRQSRAP